MFVHSLHYSMYCRWFCLFLLSLQILLRITVQQEKNKIMIAIDKLIKKYSGQVAVSIGKIEIKQGELTGLVGNNGAGKTALFWLLLDLAKTDKGKVFLKDKDVAESEEWKSYTAAYLDEGFLITYLTAYEYFYFVGKLHNLSKASVDEHLQQFDLFFEGT